MKYIFLIISVILSTVNGFSLEPSVDTLEKLLGTLDKMNPYYVKVEIDYGLDSISGYYEVDDDKYYISVDQQELYGDATTKYEVFNRRKEVVIDRVTEDKSGNLLSNPATVFSTIRNSYKASILVDNKEFTTLELTPITGGDSSIESIKLTVDKRTMLPTEIVYVFGEDEIEITIVDIQRLSSTITIYNRDKYSDYQIIDFR